MSKAMRSTYRSEEHTSELQSHVNLVCRLLLEKKNKNTAARALLLLTMLEEWLVDSISPAEALADAIHLASTRAIEPTAIAGHAFFFFNDTAPTEIYPFPLPDPLPI